jgi:hypothetical protein
MPTLVAVSVAPTNRAGPEQLAEVGLEPDLEQQDQDPQLGEGVDDRRLLHEAQPARPDDDPGQQLAEDRGLADPLHPLARDLRREPDDDQAEQ